jgi:competence protein ComEC
MKRKLKLVLILILVITFFTACAKNVDVTSTDQTTPSVNDTTTSVEESDDEIEIEYRTEEIYDRKNDEGKLVFYFMQIDEIDNTTKWGDSTLICFPNGETMLIDAGKSFAGEPIVNRLERLGIDRIDYAIASHMHADHYKGFYTIMKNIDIGVMYTPDFPCFPDEQYNKNWENALKSYGVDHLHLEVGDTLDIGDVHIEVFGPELTEANINTVVSLGKDSPRIVNNLTSIVMKLTYGETSALFTGDIYMIREIELAELFGDKLEADLLKVPHHGHDTSGSKILIDTVKPKVAVAMGNILMDPYTTYTQYVRADIKTYITVVDGMVKVVMDGIDMEVITEHDRLPNFRKTYDDKRIKELTTN